MEKRQNSLHHGSFHSSRLILGKVSPITPVSGRGGSSESSTLTSNHCRGLPPLPSFHGWVSVILRPQARSTISTTRGSGDCMEGHRGGA